MDTSQIFCTLFSGNPFTEIQFKLKHNASFCLRPRTIEQSSPEAPTRERASTPAQYDASRAPRLHLSFAHLPYDAVDGYVFGSDSERCDILLHYQARQYGISARHFSIDFSEDKKLVQPYLEIQNLSNLGTKLVRGGRMIELKKMKEKFVLLRGDILVVGPINLLVSTLEGITPANYYAHLEEYLKNRAAAIPVRPLTDMDIAKDQNPQTSTRAFKQELRLLEVLGHGATATVFKAVDRVSREICAVKVFTSTNLSGYCAREIQNLRKFESSHIVTVLFDAIVAEDSGYNVLSRRRPYFAMEYFEHGALTGLHSLSRIQTQQALHGIFSGLEYIHHKGFAHRDVKPDNVLVVKLNPLTVKLSDFGFSSKNPTATHVGTFAYAAPEVHGSERHSKTVDLWSAGIVVLTLLRLLPPFPEHCNPDLWMGTLVNTFRKLDREDFMVVLAMNLLVLFPDERSSASEALDFLVTHSEHPLGTELQGHIVPVDAITHIINCDLELTPEEVIDMESLCEIIGRLGQISSPLFYENLLAYDRRHKSVESSYYEDDEGTIWTSLIYAKDFCTKKNYTDVLAILESAEIADHLATLRRREMMFAQNRPQSSEDGKTSTDLRNASLVLEDTESNAETIIDFGFSDWLSVNRDEVAS